MPWYTFLWHWMPSYIGKPERRLPSPDDSCHLHCEQCRQMRKNPDTRTERNCHCTCCKVQAGTHIAASSPSSSAHKASSSPETPSSEVQSLVWSANLCEFCRRRPKYQNDKGYEFSYCRTCGHTPGDQRLDELCEVCHKRPKFVEATGFVHPYCGRSCASRVSARPASPQYNNSSSAPAQQALIEKANVASEESPILFYHRHDPHYGFTNFSDHPVKYHGAIYPTSEHLFQAFKFIKHRPDIAEHIQWCRSARDAFDLAHGYKSDVRADWFEVNIQKMDKVLRLKFEQHPELKEELLATRNAPLVEASDADAFWGYGADGQGRNELGQALMRLRENLRGSMSSELMTTVRFNNASSHA